MVQVMGNRILGGIGAPSGAGMAESFGAGVNTALNQRTSRQNMEQTAQNMRITEQKLKWAEEDRKRAQAAAAKAAAQAAAAKTAGRAAIDGIRTGPTGKYFIVPAASGRTPAARGAGLTFSMGTAAPVAVSGGAGVAGLRGGPGVDDLTGMITNIQSVQGTLPARAGVYTAPAAGRRVLPDGTVIAPAPSAAIANELGTVQQGPQGVRYLPPTPALPGVRTTAQTLSDATSENITPALTGGFVKRPIPPGKEFTTPVPGAYISPYGEVGAFDDRNIGRPGDFRAQATTRDLTTPAYKPPRGTGLYGRKTGAEARGEVAGRYGSSNIPNMLTYLDSVNERIAAATTAKAEGRYGENLDELFSERARMEAEIAAAQMTPAQPQFLQSRSTTADEGPGDRAERMGPPIWINGPNGPVDVATAEPYVSNPSLPVGERDFAGAPSRFGTPPDSAQPEQVEIPGFGAPAPLPSGLGEANLSFGPKLGAAPTPAQMFFMDVGRTQAGNIDLEALAADQNSPLYGDDFSAAAEASRAYYQYAAEQAYQKGDVSAYADAVAKIKEQETLILTQQLMLGEREASSYNSAQRLNAVASIVYGGADVFIQPKGDGKADLYVDGRLYDKDVDVNALALDMRMMIDKDYREATNAAMAEAAKLDDERAAKIKEIFAQGTVNQQTEGVKAEFALELAKLNSGLRSAEDLQSKVNTIDVEVVRQKYIAEGKLEPERKITVTLGANDVIFVMDDRGGKVAQFIPETDPVTGATTYSELRE